MQHNLHSLIVPSFACGSHSNQKEIVIFTIFTHVGMSWVSGVLEKIILLDPFCMFGNQNSFELENCNIIEYYREPVMIVEDNDSENNTACHHPHDEVEVGPNLEYE